MRAIRILSIQKNTDPRILSLEGDYLKRLRPFGDVQRIEIRQTYGREPNSEVVLRKEAELFEKKFVPKETLVALHENGKQYPSTEFARWLDLNTSASLPLTFIIGSAFGLHDSILKRCRHVLSLSKMTLTHEIARFVLIEAIYRASEILKGSAYHK